MHTRSLITAVLTLHLIACTASLTPPVSYDIDQSGTLVRNTPGLTPGMWYLLYDEPNMEDLTMRLSFNDETVCIQGETRGPCERSVFENDLKVIVRGDRQDGGVIVKEMEIQAAGQP